MKKTKVVGSYKHPFKAGGKIAAARIRDVVAAFPYHADAYTQIEVYGYDANKYILMMRKRGYPASQFGKIYTDKELAIKDAKKKAYGSADPKKQQDTIPVIVKAAMTETVTDIGQLTPYEKKELNKYVKKGVLIKGLGGGFPKAKTVYAIKGFDIQADRERQVKEMLRLADLDEKNMQARKEGKMAKGGTLAKDQVKANSVYHANSKKDAEDYIKKYAKSHPTINEYGPMVAMEDEQGNWHAVPEKKLMAKGGTVGEFKSGDKVTLDTDKMKELKRFIDNSTTLRENKHYQEVLSGNVNSIGDVMDVQGDLVIVTFADGYVLPIPKKFLVKLSPDEYAKGGKTKKVGKELYVAVNPTFGDAFAFNADSQADAEDKIADWNNYHSFRDPGSKHTVRKIDETEIKDLKVGLHNEYVYKDGGQLPAGEQDFDLELYDLADKVRKLDIDHVEVRGNALSIPLPLGPAIRRSINQMLDEFPFPVKSIIVTHDVVTIVFNPDPSAATRVGEDGRIMAAGGMVNHGFFSGDKIVAIYKGYGIIDSGGVIEVINPEKGTRFIIDFDDSKIGGNKRSGGMTYDEQVKAAKEYIDQARPVDMQSTEKGYENTAYTKQKEGDVPAGPRIVDDVANQYTEHKMPFIGRKLEGRTLRNGGYVVLYNELFPLWLYSVGQGKWLTTTESINAEALRLQTASRPSWDAENVSLAELFAE